MKFAFGLMLLASVCHAQFSGSGSMSLGQGGLNGWQQNTPAISALTSSSSATTVVLQWTTDLASDSRGHCGSEEAVDDGIQSGATSHEIIVAGLAPSTSYTCTVQSGSTTSTVAAVTTSLSATTPITGISLGTATQYNSTAPHQMSGDTFFNCVSNDGTTYLTTDDTQGWSASGSSASFMLAKFTSLSPITGTDVNLLSAYGPCCTAQPPFGFSPKDNGLFCMSGNLHIFMTNLDPATVNFPQHFGSIIISPDHGATWNNMQAPTAFTSTGTVMTPTTITLFPGSGPSNFASSTFVMYGADDGTLGYTVAVNRFDNADAFVYGVAADSSSQWNANSYYLWRIPRAKLGRLNPTDYQFYVSGDGTLDSAWTSTQASATAILTNTGNLSLPSVQYIPALNRYLLTTYKATVNTGTPSETSWTIYESPHPWGAWTQIGSESFPTTGCYNPVMLNADAIVASLPTVTMRLMWSCNFTTGGSGIYNLFYATMTVTH